MSACGCTARGKGEHVGYEDDEGGGPAPGPAPNDTPPAPPRHFNVLVACQDICSQSIHPSDCVCGCGCYATITGALPASDADALGFVGRCAPDPSYCPTARGQEMTMSDIYTYASGEVPIPRVAGAAYGSPYQTAPRGPYNTTKVAGAAIDDDYYGVYGAQADYRDRSNAQDNALYAAYGATVDGWTDADCTTARSGLCSASGNDPHWCNADCATLRAKLQADCTVFPNTSSVGIDARCVGGSTWSSACPQPAGACTGSTGGGGGPPPPPTSDNTLLYVLGGLGLAGILAYALSQSGGGGQTIARIVG